LFQGYPLTPYSIRPYTDNEVGKGGPARRKRRIKFNQQLASARVVVEHVNARFKSRFPSLKLFSGRNIDYIYAEVTACIIVDQYCRSNGDTGSFDNDPYNNPFPSDDEPDSDDEDPVAREHRIQAETANTLRREGRSKRRRLMRDIWHM